MGGGRKNLKRAFEAEMMTLQQGQSIMQVVDLRGNNLIEVLPFIWMPIVYKLKVMLMLMTLFVKVMDSNGQKLLAIFPAKFQKSMWIKRGMVHEC